MALLAVTTPVPTIPTAARSAPCARRLSPPQVRSDFSAGFASLRNRDGGGGGVRLVPLCVPLRVARCVPRRVLGCVPRDVAMITRVARKTPRFEELQRWQVTDDRRDPRGPKRDIH